MYIHCYILSLSHNASRRRSWGRLPTKPTNDLVALTFSVKRLLWMSVNGHVERGCRADREWAGAEHMGQRLLRLIGWCRAHGPKAAAPDKLGCCACTDGHLFWYFFWTLRHPVFWDGGSTLSILYIGSGWNYILVALNLKSLKCNSLLQNCLCLQCTQWRYMFWFASCYKC